MRIFNIYLIFLVIAACIINITLAFLGQTDLSVYFIVNVIAFLVITLMHTYLNRSSRRLLGGISAVLFAGFAIVAALKIIEAL